MFSKVFVENASDHCVVPALGIYLPFKAFLVGLTGDLPQHLQVMINLLRCEDRIKLVRAEGSLQMQLEPPSIVILLSLTLLTSSQGAGVPFSDRGIPGCMMLWVLCLAPQRSQERLRISMASMDLC